jgi:CheY-like chemotaxis protein
LNELQHTVLCVDDEENILNAMKRLLRKENYRLVTARNGTEGLEILRKENVHLVISDQRMPGMSGVEFLARIKEEYPDIIRIVLTGYTEVDSIMESINKGHIFKFILKPWNDQNLRLEIRQGLEQHDLIQANKSLSERIMQQNETLKDINETLELRVRERTKELEIQNCALETARAILEELPVPVIGVSDEGIIVFLNRRALSLGCRDARPEIGREFSDCFLDGLAEKVGAVLATENPEILPGQSLNGVPYRVDIVPLSGGLRARGVILVFSECKGAAPLEVNHHGRDE